MVSDVNPKAIDYVKLTVKLNDLGDRVRYCTSDLVEGRENELFVEKRLRTTFR